MAMKKMKKPVEKGVAKVPVIMQMEALECGAACLTMVMAYYDKWIPLEQVRADCGVSRDGSNAKNVLLAAKSYGMEVRGYRFEPEALRAGGSFPCIIHWCFNHFVVLCGFKGNKAILNDPARGTVAVTMEQFDESFTGICLMMEPGEDFAPSGKPKSIWGFVKKRLKGAGPAIAFVVLVTLISQLINIIKPGFSRILVDRLLTGKNPEWLRGFTVGFALLAVVQIIVELLRCLYLLRIGGKLAAVGSTSFMWKILRLPMEFFSQRMAGDIQSRQASNANIAQQLIDTLAPLALNSMMMVFYLVVMIRYNVLLTLIGVFSVAVNLFVSRIISRKRVNITRVQMRDAGKLAGTTVAGIEMIESIKASGAENGYFERWAGYQASVNTQTVKYVKLNNFFGIVPAAVTMLTDIFVLSVAVALTFSGQFTVGMILAFQGFLSSFTAPATMLINAGQIMQEMRTDMERIEDVMEYPSDVNVKDEAYDESRDYSKLRGSVELRNVTFGYSKLAEPLIRDFNMTVKPGSRIAFVGASGCGKSTVTKLISGLYQPWSGEVLFDGKPMREIDRSVITSSVAVVDQEIVLFEDTIANNIRMFDRSIEDYEVILAARDAQIHDDIMRRNGGYQHKLIEGGKDFSGGQRQRLEIARVLAQDPTIIIMDEATSALDAKTEYDVVKSITDRGITCIIVAHRLSTIRDCDEIIVMDHGNVVERGTHAELMALGGYYTTLVTSE